MALKIDDAVTIKHTLLSGVVTGATLDEIALVITYKVKYDDNDGVEQERYFSEDQLVVA
jgi:hypothetical protein